MIRAILEMIGYIFWLIGCIAALSAAIALGVKFTIEFMKILEVVR